jgi:phosphohistidine phosphatase
MDLYLIRHADALPLGEQGVTTDGDRPLSDKGERQSAALGNALRQQDIRLDRLYTSPLVRARRTAELLLPTYGRPELTAETIDQLVPSTRPRKLSRFLLKQDGQSIGLVGHMPHLAVFLGWLIGDKRVQIEIAKAGVAHLTCGDVPGKGLATLRWLVGPEWFGK